MSRYINGQYVYGFDNPLSQYFLSKGNKHLCGPLSKTHGDNYTLIELMKRENLWDKINEEHKQLITGDLPV
jgi:hypothetical protein